MSTAEQFIDSKTLRQWLDDAEELALIDVREAGLFGAGHALLAVNIPYSRLELDIGQAVPRAATRTVLIAENDAAAQQALAALRARGHGAVHALAGGTEAWRAAGEPVLEGVNVPSKAFAEFVEHHYHTPDIAPAELLALQQAGADLVLLDSRTLEEYRRFHVPGAISCPGGELPLRFDDLVPSPHTRVVVSCAGRTRGVMGAQTLINLGIPNPVQALAGGTQGWKLAGLQVTDQGGREYGDVSAAARTTAAQRAAALGQRHAIAHIDTATLAAWRADAARTTYVFDVRTEAEYLAGHLPGAVWAQGVQLVQCLDQWAAVRKARLVLVDDDGTRATATAHWLQQLGWQVSVLQADAAARSATGAPAAPAVALPEVAWVDAATAARQVARGAQLVDVSSSAQFRRSHPVGARWSNRARVAEWRARLRPGGQVLVLAEDDQVAQLFALSLQQEWGDQLSVAVLRGGLAAWAAQGLATEATPELPVDAERIDFLFWLHDRHEGNAAASAAYLQWEADLPATLGSAAAAAFRFPV